MNLLFFDTETTGLPKKKYAPLTDFINWPRMVQIGWIYFEDEKEVTRGMKIIKPDGFEIPKEASDLNGITQEKALTEGINLRDVFKEFGPLARKADVLIGHNISFDLNIVGAESFRIYERNFLEGKKSVCTMFGTIEFCQIPSQFDHPDSRYKWPKLGELYKKLFNEELVNAHDALIDIEATAKCYFKLKELNIL